MIAVLEGGLLYAWKQALLLLYLKPVFLPESGSTVKCDKGCRGCGETRGTSGCQESWKQSGGCKV